MTFLDAVRAEQARLRKLDDDYEARLRANAEARTRLLAERAATTELRVQLEKAAALAEPSKSARMKGSAAVKGPAPPGRRKVTDDLDGRIVEIVARLGECGRAQIVRELGGDVAPSALKKYLLALVGRGMIRATGTTMDRRYHRADMKGDVPVGVDEAHQGKATTTASSTFVPRTSPEGHRQAISNVGQRRTALQLQEQVLDALRERPSTLADLAARFEVDNKRIWAAVDQIQRDAKSDRRAPNVVTVHKLAPGPRLWRVEERG